MFARRHSRLLGGLFKAPDWLFRLGLGGLLGHRFLELTHRGRRSGRHYRTVLEVVGYDPHAQESVACSGWGTRADWYQNIIAHPPIAIETGGRRYEHPRFRELTPAENYPIVAEYMRRLPRIAWTLADLLKSAGFSEISVHVESHAFRYADLDEYLRSARNTGERRRLDALSAVEAERVRSALAPRFVAYQKSDGLHIPAAALLAIAAR